MLILPKAKPSLDSYLLLAHQHLMQETDPRAVSCCAEITQQALPHPSNIQPLRYSKKEV